MTVEEFKAEVTKWLDTARHPRWKRPYTELVYQPMLEVLRFLRRTYIVTGGGQDFARLGYEKYTESRRSKWMLEYRGAGDGARLMMLVLHDDAQREYAYGPAPGLPDTKVGTFTQALY